MADAQCMKCGWLTIKSGLLRSKQKKWCQLYSKGDHDDPWLEFYDTEEQAKSHPKSKKIHTLHNVKGVDRIVRDSAKEYYLEIRLKRDKDIVLYFENGSDLEAWNCVLSVIVRIIQTDVGSSQGDDNEGGSELQQNILYQPAEDSMQFEVKLERTDAAEKKGLEFDKVYKLHVTGVSLMLEDPTRGVRLFTWILDYIRSYGASKSNTSFSIMAGRRCETGEGEFKFRLENPSLLTQAINLKASQKQKEREKKVSLDQDAQPSEKDKNKTERSSSVSTPPTINESNKNDKRSKSKSLDKNQAKEKEKTRTSLGSSVKMDPSFQKELSSKITNPPGAPPSRESLSKGEKDKEKKEHSKKENKDRHSKDQTKKEDKEKKSGFNPFKKHKDKKDKTIDNTESGDLNEKELIDEHIYDEASDIMKPEIVPRKAPPRTSQKSPPVAPHKKSGALQPPAGGALYSEVNSVRKPHAWENVPDSNEYHMENYNSIKDAAKENANNPPFEQDYSDDDVMYDSLNPKEGALRSIVSSNESDYGMTSGRPLLPKKQLDDQDLYDNPAEEEQTVEYEDAASVMRVSTQQKETVDFTPSEYEDVEIAH